MGYDREDIGGGARDEKKQAARRKEWRTDEKEDLKSAILQNQNPNQSWWTTITQTWHAERRGGQRTKTKKLDWHPPNLPHSFLPLRVPFIQTSMFNAVFNTVNQLTSIVD